MQLVKKYVDIVGDRRIGTESKTAIEQINQDLKENSGWQIHSLIVSGAEFYVVYNITKSRISLLEKGFTQGGIDVQHESEDNSIVARNNVDLASRSPIQEKYK